MSCYQSEEDDDIIVGKPTANEIKEYFTKERYRFFFTYRKLYRVVFA